MEEISTTAILSILAGLLGALFCAGLTKTIRSGTLNLLQFGVWCAGALCFWAIGATCVYILVGKLLTLNGLEFIPPFIRYLYGPYEWAFAPVLIGLGGWFWSCVLGLFCLRTEDDVINAMARSLAKQASFFGGFGVPVILVIYIVLTRLVL